MMISLAMRVEWAKAHARHRRWEEELELVLEEIRRVPWYLSWKAQWWEERAYWRRETASPEVYEGCIAYAAKQAEVHRSLARKFTNAWLERMKELKVHVSWSWPDFCISPHWVEEVTVETID
jgi:hypothetical protein